MFDLLVNFKIIFSKIHRHFTSLDWLSGFTFLAFQIAQVTPTHVQLYVFFEHLTACEYCHKLVLTKFSCSNFGCFCGFFSRRILYISVFFLKEIF